MRQSPLPLSAALAGLLALAGCTVTPAGVVYNPYPQPPPVRIETIPPPPVSAVSLIWQPGHWDWNGQGYLWQSGRWVERAGHGTTWQDGYWSNASGVWTWVPAHWV